MKKQSTRKIKIADDLSPTEQDLKDRLMIERAANIAHRSMVGTLAGAGVDLGAYALGRKAGFPAATAIGAGGGALYGYLENKLREKKEREQAQKQASYRLKTAAVDLNKIKSLGLDVEYGEEPEELVMKTRGGHSVYMPYREGTVKHHIARMGEDAYHQGLANALTARGKEIDDQVKYDRDELVKNMKTVNTVGGGLLGGTMGGLAGAALGEAFGGKMTPSAVAGAALGTLAGGYLGRRAKVKPMTGPESFYGEELGQLYKTPRHVAALQKEVQDLRDAYEDSYEPGRRYYDDAEGYYNYLRPGRRY